MSIFADAGFVKSTFQPCLNTGTILDIALGEYILGTNGEWILSGGLPPIFSIVGRGGTYKSTMLDSIIARVLVRYPLIEVLKYDTEQNAFTITRFDKMAKTEEVSHRIFLTNQATTDSEEFHHNLANLIKLRKAKPNDYMVESPFLDLNTGKPHRMWIPLFIYIDSFSCMRPAAEDITAVTISAEDSANNTNDMRDGKIKKALMQNYSRWASQYGFYFLLTAQIDDTVEISKYAVLQKQNQWLKGNSRIKNVGSQFKFLTNTMLETRSPTPILASDKKSIEYANGVDTTSDINAISVNVIRCKTNMAGSDINFVISQNLGVLSDLTNYHYLKNHEDFGFITKGHNRYTVLTPDVKLHRNDIIETLDKNYEVCRALEILSQLKWMLSYWNTKNLDSVVPDTAERFVEMIAANNKLLTSDILNSRGYWTYNKEDKRPYLSTMDIIDKIQANK